MILDRLINCFNLALIFGTISCKCASDIIGVTSCCDFDDQIACLSAKNISVANRIFHEKAKHDASFTLVTYTTTSIFNYSLYSFAVNSVHADLNGHNMILTSDALGAEFERHDQRWNKVKVMEVIIKNHLHEAFDVEKDQYLVWMDSDLIFLDLHFNLTEIVQQHAHADLIVSQDVDRLNGIVNTGCMIMRCSEWSLRFLQDWWAWADHVEGMDQHVFDRLYQHLLETESTNCTADVDITDTREVITARKECAKTKIVILPPHALNSHIPARQHQHPSHQIMHLAGESSAVRAHVFRAAFAEICRAYTSAAVSTSQTLMETLKAVPSNPPAVPAVPTKLPAVFGSQEQVPTSAWVNLVAPQLGVTRDFLQKIDVASLLVAEIRCILDEMNSCSAQAPLLCDLVTIDKLRARLRDAMQSRGDAAHRQADQINAQRSNNASYAELYTLYLTGLRWGVSAHLIVYQQLSSTNHWHQHQHHELVKEPNIDQWVSAFEQLEVWLPAAQGLINAVFELCDAIENTTEKEQALNTMHPVLSTLLDLACGGGGSSGNSNGSGGSGSSEWSGGSGNSDGSGDRKRSKACAPVLYYQVKYLQFRADYFQHFAQRAEEMHALNKALTVWAQLDALGHYGSGNKLSDPHKEVSVLLTRMARLLCLTSATYDSDSLAVNKAEENAKLKQGLEYVLRSLNYTAHAWLSPTQHQTLLSSTAPSSTAASSWSTEKRAGIESIFAVNALLQVPSKVLLRLVEGCHCAQQCLSSSTTAMESAALGITGLPVRDNNTNHKQKKVFAWLLLRFCDALSAQGRPCDPALRLHQQQQAGEQATLSPRVKKTLKRLKRKT